MKVRFIRMIMLSIFGVLAGCDSFNFVSTFSEIEITEKATGERVASAKIEVSIRRNASLACDVFGPLAPTDEMGRTLVPFRVVADEKNVMFCVRVTLGLNQA